jgi:hypothetical protein
MMDDGDDGFKVSGSSVIADSSWRPLARLSTSAGLVVIARGVVCFDCREDVGLLGVKVSMEGTDADGVLTRPSFDKIGMLENESRFF